MNELKKHKHKQSGSVQHLVGAANDAAQGNATEEALVVAARAVAAATTQVRSIDL